MIKKHIRVWQKLASNNFSSYFANPLDISCYLAGKIIRFVLFLVFLLYLVQKSQSLVTFNRYEVLFFYLVFNFVDIIAQSFMRGTYDIGNRIRRGQFDFFLAQPVNVVFRSLSCIVDVLDFLTLIPVVPLLFWTVSKLPVSIGLPQVFTFVLLLVNGLLIALAFHILAAGIAVFTFESHHVMFLYRNLLNMVRFPIDIYPSALQFVMTVFVPVGVMVAFPAKALLGLLSWQWVIYSFFIAAVFLFGSLKFWHFSLRHYQSASS